MADVFDAGRYLEAAQVELERFEVPGASVAVVRDGETLLTAGLGIRNIETNDPVTAETVLAIGSTTKPFTTSVLGTMVDEGLLDWDEPIRTYLPTFRMHDPVATEYLSLRDALSHRTGLPRHDLLWYDNLEITRAEIVERLRHLEPSRQFRQTWQYNNLMYILAGHLTETILDCSWDDAVRQRIFEPLGMTSSCFWQAEMEKSPEYSFGYTEIEDALVPYPLPRDDACASAGVIKSTANDMAAWVGMNASAGEWNGTRVLSESTIRNLTAPTMVRPEASRLFPETPYPVAMGMGWHIDSYRGHKLVHHGGNIDGFSSQCLFLPDINAGVVTLTNRHVTQLRDVLAWLGADMLLGLEPVPWGERYDDIRKNLKAGTKDAKERRRETARDLPPSHAIEEYAGAYHHPGYGTLTISAEEGQLVPSLQSLQFTMSHRHHDTWILKHELSEAEYPLTFATDAEGYVASLSVPLEPAVAAIVFARQPDTTLADPEKLAAYTGDYKLGPMTLRVELENDVLYVGIVGQPRTEVVPYKERIFRTKGPSNQKIEFVLGADGKVTEVHASGVVFRPE